MNNFTGTVLRCLLIFMLMFCHYSHFNIGIHASTAENSQTDKPRTTEPLQQCITIMNKSIEHAAALIPTMSAAADVVAQRWIAGSDIYTAGDPCATDELFYRAGGLIGLKRVGPYNRNFNGIQVRWNNVPVKKSIILYSMHRNVEPNIILFEELNHLIKRGDTVILFGSSRWMSCQRLVKALQKGMPIDRFFFIDSELPTDTSFSSHDGTSYGDYAGMVTTLHSWAFTAELIAACTRQHKTPAIWPSGAIPGFEAWEEKYQTTAFHDTIAIPPIQAGYLGKKYLQTLQQQIEACAASTSQLQHSAKILAAVPADRAVYVMVESHLLANETRFPKEIPNWILAQRHWRWSRAASTVEKGDAILWLGAFDWPEKQIEQASKLENPFVAVSLFGPGQNPQHTALQTPSEETARGYSMISIKPQLSALTPLPPKTTWIPAPWQYPDAVLEIENYPLPACPTSSIIQGTLMWGLIGEILEIRN